MENSNGAPSEGATPTISTWQLTEIALVRFATCTRLTDVHSVKMGLTLRGVPEWEHNFSFTVAPERATVHANYRRVCEALGFEPSRLIVPAQVHGTHVAIVTEEDTIPPPLPATIDSPLARADAVVTRSPGLLLGITAADCLPLFFLNPVNRSIGLAHSGWRGTAGRIAAHTLETMRAAFDTRPQDCLVAIGPGIGGDGYEVDSHVYEAFLPEDGLAPEVFAPTRPGHWHLDLTAAVQNQLLRAGVPSAQILSSPWRTHRETDLFFSHRLHPGCPRMGAFLGIRC